jgi:hypothetical protein
MSGFHIGNSRVPTKRISGFPRKETVTVPITISHRDCQVPTQTVRVLAHRDCSHTETAKFLHRGCQGSHTETVRVPTLRLSGFLHGDCQGSHADCQVSIQRLSGSYTVTVRVPAHRDCSECYHIQRSIETVRVPHRDSQVCHRDCQGSP